MAERIEPDSDVVRRIAAIATRLPEVVEEDAWTGVRWRVRTHTFAHVMVAQEGQEYDASDWIRPETVVDAILHLLDLPRDATISDLTVRPGA